MIVKKTKDKKVIWGFRYRYKIDNKWLKKECYNKNWSKRQAEQEERIFIDGLNDPKGENLNFNELYDMFFDHKKSKLKVRAYNDMKTSCDRHILSYFKIYKIQDIKSLHIEKWQHGLLNATYHRNGIEKVYANRQLEKIQINLNAILTFAFDRELIERNPFRACGIVKRREEIKEEDKRFITVEEFNRIIEAIELSNANELTKSQDMVIFSILFWCGLRKGEMMALDIQDYNFIKKELKVYKNWDYVNKLITPPKTKNSIRTVVVPDVVDTYIIKLVSMYRKMYDYTIDKCLVSYDQRIAPTTLTRKKEKYCKIAGVKMSIHDFRHSHVSLLVNSGLQPFEIAKRLGHTVEMVNEVYGHLYPSKQKEMVEMMNLIT